MCHAVNEATIIALEKGIVTCGSIMVPCPWFLEIAEYCREHPQADLGIHITLTSEWKYYRWGPVSLKVPSLIDKEGYLWRSVEDVVKHATPEEVETEIRAQVQRAIDFGIKPTHIDTHMLTVYALPEFSKSYYKVAHEFGIPVLNDIIIGVNIGEIEPRRKEYKKIICNLRPGVTQIIVHMALDHPEMHWIGQWSLRYYDFLIFTDPEMKQFIEEQGVKLIGSRN